MCTVYSPSGITNGVCTGSTSDITLLNKRNITCDLGYTTDGTVAGRYLMFTGPGVPPPCIINNTCTQFSPNPYQAVCVPGDGWRTITCNLGYSTDNTDAGKFQNLTGSTPDLNCSGNAVSTSFVRRGLFSYTFFSCFGHVW